MEKICVSDQLKFWKMYLFLDRLGNVYSEQLLQLIINRTYVWHNITIFIYFLLPFYNLFKILKKSNY
jgi:hypothetical protein